MDRFMLLDVSDPDNSFDCTVVGVVNMTSALSKLILGRGKTMRKLKEVDAQLASCTYFDGNIEFYMHDLVDLDVEVTDKLTDEETVFLPTNPYEGKENEGLNYCLMKVVEDGVYWVTSAKHSGSEASTNVVPYNEIERFI